MDTNSLLVTHMGKALNELVKNPIIIEGKISIEKLQKPRMRAQVLVETPRNIVYEGKGGEMMPLMDIEVQHCAAVIAAAFFNPVLVMWDYDRFAESAKKRESKKFFADVHLGLITKPTTIVDMHGRILLWYLPSLLLPHRVEELNRVTKCLKQPLCDSIEKGKGKSNWRMTGFTLKGEEAIFGAGKLSLSIGKFLPGQQRLQDSIYPSPHLRTEAVCQWLELIDPVEQLLNAVLQIVHPEMYEANSKVTPLLLQQLNNHSLTWPTIYPGMDVIANRITPEHCDRGGALSFYDHLISFGQGHDAQLQLHDLDAEFAYQPGTSVLFPGMVLMHSVPEWSEGERLVIAHYAKDDVQDRLEVARPLLPTQLGWWSMYNVPK